MRDALPPPVALRSAVSAEAGRAVTRRFPADTMQGSVLGLPFCRFYRTRPAELVRQLELFPTRDVHAQTRMKSPRPGAPEPVKKRASNTGGSPLAPRPSASNSKAPVTVL